MVKVSTTVFKVLVFEKPALFLIFSDYGHICFWNYTQQLHTTAFAVTGCWCSSSNVFFQLPCWPCVHSSANIPRQKVHHVFSHGFFFNSLVTNFPIVTVAWALQNFWNNQLHWTLDANYHWLNHIPLEWEMNFQTRFTWLQTERLLCKQQEGIALWRPVPAAGTVITLCQESFLNWQKVDNSSSLKQNVSGTLYVILHRQRPGLWKPHYFEQPCNCDMVWRLGLKTNSPFLMRKRNNGYYNTSKHTDHTMAPVYTFHNFTIIL